MKIGNTIIENKEYEIAIKPDIENKKQLNVFCSFTFITPNNSILFTLNELKRFVKQGNFKIFLMIWDMNTLSNPYFKRLCGSRKITDPDFFINKKVAELKDLAESMGFDKEKVSVYKSSDLWKRFIAYEEDNIFQEFYSVLAQMKIKDYVENHKVNHLFQLPMDIFFCNNFHKFFPEDTSKPMDIAFFGQDKEKLYRITRELMLKEGLIENEKPAFALVKNFPYLIYNHNVPEWNMGLKDIKNILVNFPLKRKEIFVLFKYIASGSESEEIVVKVDQKSEKYTYDEFCNEFEKTPDKELLNILSENLFAYLKNHRKKYLETSGKLEETVLSITKRKDVKGMGQVLKSDIALEIILLSDGTMNTSQISRKLGKSVATISTYATRLKKMNLIRVLSNGNLKRNIKGIKVNFELGL